ncbi:UGT80A2 [Symbiodinium sp. CCMP2456]|nr:UGT80A2 [Symbiodinium sp. CCMP2456]
MATSSAPRRILIVYTGTRGDWQPYVVAGTILREAGYEVQLCGPGDAAGMAEDHDLPFKRIRVSTLRTWPEKLTEQITHEKIPQVPPRNDRDAMIAEKKASYELFVSFKPELVLTAALTLLEVSIFSEIFDDIPFVNLGLQTPPGHSSNLAGFRFPRLLKPLHWQLNKFILAATLKMLRKELDSIPEALPEEMRKLCPKKITKETFVEHWSDSAVFPNLVAQSTSINGDLGKDYKTAISLGPLMLPPSSQSGQEFGGDQMKQMEDFLAQGDAPVYIGFGSMKAFTPKYMTLLCARALQLTGLRGVICAGWTGVDLQHLEGEADELELAEYVKNNVLFMPKSPHGLLFPRCQAIVHHGGAGTMNASVRSGKPTIIIPVLLDQFGHARLINEMGIGKGLKHLRHQTPATIAAVIKECIDSQSIRTKAEEVGSTMRREEAQAPARLTQFVQEYFRDYVDGGLFKSIMRDTRERRAQQCCKC